MAGGEGRYLGAAVQRGLPEGAAAQDADGDVVQLLLLRRAAGSRPRARVPATPGLASKVRVDGIAVSLVLAQHRHGGGPRIHGGQRRPRTASLALEARQRLRRPRGPGSFHGGFCPLTRKLFSEFPAR